MRQLNASCAQDYIMTECVVSHARRSRIEGSWLANNAARQVSRCAPQMLKAATSLNHPIVLATGELAFLAHPMATTRVGDPKDSVDVDLTPQFYEY